MAQFFDEAFYLRRYQDVREALESGNTGFTSALDHFEQFGRNEGRDPNAYFDSSYYLAQNPDVAAVVGEGLAFASGYDHFLAHGIFEPRKTSAFFDAQYYTNASGNQDVRVAVFQGQTTAFDHFFHHGRVEYRQATANFDPTKYVQANSDLTDAVNSGAINAYDHLTTFGMPEDRDLGNGIRLGDLSFDTTIRNAIFEGDASGAMARIEAILPLIPAYERPDDYVLSSTATLTADFIADPGILLALPIEVAGSVSSPTTSYSAITYQYSATQLTLAGTGSATGTTLSLATTPDSIILSNGTVKLRDDITLTQLDYSGLSGGTITVVGDDNPMAFIAGSIATNINAAGGNDTITGSSTADTILGGDGEDSITGSGGNDSIDGGIGNDIIIADLGADTIIGGTGNDSITSGDGIDSITGGAGDDTISGGSGVDTFIFSADNGLDTITAFTSNADKLSVGALFTTSTVANPTAVAQTSSAVVAGALTDEQVYVISNGGVALTALGTETIADYSNLTDVAAYLAEGYTSTAVNDGAVFIINSASGTASVYSFNENAADGIEAEDLSLVATITGSVIAADIL